MSSREGGGHPGPEHSKGGTAVEDKTPAQAKETKAPDSKGESSVSAGHSPAEARLQSSEVTVSPDGTIKTKKTFFENVPEPMSATELARAKAAESGGAKKDAETKSESGEKDADKKEGAEAGKEKKEEKPVTGEAVVEAVKNDPHAPKETKDALKDPHNAKDAAQAVENKSIFGQKTKNFFRRFGTGMAAVGAKAGIKFLAKRTLDFGTVGAGAIAGAAVGGTVEGVRAWRAETKRLYDLKTYEDALAGYDSMTNLEKVTAIIALEEKLKEKFSDRTLKPEEHSRLSNLKLDLRQRMEAVAGKDKVSEKEEDVKNLEKLLGFRAGQATATEKDKNESGKFKQLIGLFRHGKDSKHESDKDKEKDLLGRAIGLGKVLASRGDLDTEMLKEEQSKEVKALLEKFYKERGLQRNGKKIALETAKGVVFGAAGGAFGAWAFEHAAHFAADHGWISQSLVANADTHHAPGAPVEASHAASVPGAEVISHVPSAEDAQILKTTVWDTCKHYMEAHGVPNPSAHDINEAMLRICKENGIEISGHHDIGDFPGFHHEHFKDLIDIKLQNGLKLIGFDKLSDLINHAGGHAAGAQEIISNIPAAALAKEGAKETAKHLAEQSHALRNVLAVLGLGGGALYLVKRNNRKAEQQSKEMSLNLKDANKQAETPAVNKFPVEFVGSAEELKIATLERRLELLSKIGTEAISRIFKAGEHLDDPNPDVAAFRTELLKVEAIYNKEQLERLCYGASVEDVETIKADWKFIGVQLTEVGGSFEQRIQELLSRSEETSDQDAPDDEDMATKTTAKPGKVEEEEDAETGPGWIEEHDKGRKDLNKSLASGKKALESGDLEQAASHHLEAAKAIAALAIFAKGLKPSERKFAEKQIDTLQKKADALDSKIKQAKEAKAALEATGVKDSGKKENPEAKKLGLEDWQVRSYHRMIDLRLIAPLPDGQKFEPRSGNLDRLNNFVLFTKENGGPFKSMFPGRGREKRDAFLQALTDLRDGNQTTLKDFCLDILRQGQTPNKRSMVSDMLNKMGKIATEVSTVIAVARAEFKP